jgi:hypothetical protein
MASLAARRILDTICVCFGPFASGANTKVDLFLTCLYVCAHVHNMSLSLALITEEKEGNMTFVWSLLAIEMMH